VGGRQIRWGSVGKAAAIVAAAIAGIASLPALLGSDRPPPVPPDVGLAPPPTSAPLQAPVTPPPARSTPPTPTRRDHHRLAKRKRDRERSHPRRERSHPDREHPHPHRKHARHPHEPDAPPVASPPAYAPPVYSYVPPPSQGEFQIER
jgi:hypothetical protein